ncbi:MAG: DUF1573 domain-containing protein [Planctomycetaceae bacterium]|jgi:hypothetical protein|nr:DUF1573 domain-containing protein [Planctomycetaceae bacterium]
MKRFGYLILVFAILVFAIGILRAAGYAGGQVALMIWQPRIVCVEPLHDFGKITVSHQPRSNNESQPNNDPKSEPNSASETLAQQKLPREKPTHEFIIKNEGNANLIIHKVTAGCGSCVEVESFTKTPIAPQKSGSVILKLLTDNLSGKISKEVLVRSNDPKNHNFFLTLEAEIVSE